MSEARGAGPRSMSHREILQALSGLLLVLFVAISSSTVVATALPRMLADLNGTQTQYTWVVTAALLSATATTPIWGRLADLFSKKLVVQVAIVVFVVGSMLSGLARTAGEVIAARAVQGVGIGGLQALVQIVIAAIIAPRERGRYNGYVAAVLAAASLGGPLLGGVMVDTPWLGWRWCFFVALPVAAAAFAVLQFTLRLPVVRKANVKIDYLGAGLIALGVCVLLIWVSLVGGSFAWVSWQTAALVGTGVVLLAASVWVERRAAQPVVPLHVITKRTPALAILASLAVGMAIFGGSVFLSQYFQVGRGYPPTSAGLLTIPNMFGTVASSVISGRLISRSGRIKPYLLAGTIIMVLGFLLLGFIDRRTPLPVVFAGMLLIGAGVGMTMQNLVLTVQNAVPLHELGAASGSVTFFRSLGGSIGVAVLGAVLASQVHASITRQLPDVSLSAAGSSGVAPAGIGVGVLHQSPGVQVIVQSAYAHATAHIFLLSAAIGLVGVIAVTLLAPVTLRSTVDLVD